MDKNVFKKRYSFRKKLCKEIGNLGPIKALVHELLCEEDGIKYMKLIEQDLWNQGVVPFKVKKVEDLYYIEHLNYTVPEAKDIQRFIWKALSENNRN